MFVGVELAEASVFLFSDDFVDLNDWTVVNGVWDVSDGMLEGSATVNAEGLIWAGERFWMNYNATANVRILGPGDEASIVVMYTDEVNFYWLGLGCGGHKYSIARVVDGVYEELAYFGLDSEVEVYRWYTLTVAAVSGTLQLFVDGVKVLEVQDDSHPYGAFGFRTWKGSMQAEQLIVQLVSPSSSLSPNYYETSEYLIGRVAVGVILLESNGNIDPATESWSSPRESEVISQIQNGLFWLENYMPSANVSFIYEIHLRVPTSYEPINRPHTDQRLWIEEAMTYLGYPGISHVTQVREYINDLRVNLEADWAFAIFVVDSYNDPDGRFTSERSDGQGKMSAHSFLGGPYLVMTYDNGGYSISNMDYVTAHETCHIFYATDEYNGRTEISGYLGVQDMEGSECMMDKANVWWLCTNSMEQLGWRDSNGNGLLDIVDTYPSTILYPYYANPTNQNTLVYCGFVSEVPYPNNNPLGYGRDITINTITDVKFRVNGGPWQSALAQDGEFNQAQEAFYFTVSYLPEGTHVIEACAVNSVGNMETAYTIDTVTVDRTPPRTSIILQGFTGNSGYFLSDVTVSLSATDSITSVLKTEYSFDNSTWIAYTGSFEIKEDGSTIIYYRSTDLAGNVEKTKNHIIKIDKTAPVGSIAINDNAEYSTSNAVTLTLSAFDADSGVAQMRLSEDGVFDDGSWETFASSKSWILSAVDGVKTVYVQFKDAVGHVSTTYSATIILSTTPPTGSIQINEGDTFTTSTQVTLYLTYSESASQVCYSNDGVFETEVWEAPSATRTWTLASDDGEKTVYYQVKNAAG
jgi:hypothetical protein